RKPRSAGPADSSEASRWTSLPGSPRLIVASARTATSSRLSPSLRLSIRAGPASPQSRCSGLAAGAERAQHLFSDVDPRAGEDGLLQDDVVLLLLGDLLDHAIRAIDHHREFLVAALVEVFAKLALLALEVFLEIGILALAA